MLSPEVLAAAVLIALALDRWFGEPPARWHPVVWVGHYLGWAGCRVAPLAAEAAAVGGGASFGSGRPSFFAK